MQKFFAPGRVNLIGEHLDYNGGLVLPVAINLGITATVTHRADNKIILRSKSHVLGKEVNLDDPIYFDPANEWANYPLGVIALLQDGGHKINAVDILYESTLPQGSGLSSSAAIEMLTAFAILTQTESKINLVWLANFCKQVENDFIGVQCGIMDQYAVGLGKKDNALLLNCHTLTKEDVPFALGEYRLVIMDTKKPRSLIYSKYNERKKECEEALKQIQYAKSGVENLCEAEMLWLDILKDPTLKKRAKHVISEQIRVRESAKVLQMNDLSTFGRLMNASHESLKSDYEVSSIELDTLVDTAQKIQGCLGARMTGAGFGGCAIAIVHSAAVQEFTNMVSEKYFSSIGFSCEIHICEVGDGVRQFENTAVS